MNLIIPEKFIFGKPEIFLLTAIIFITSIILVIIFTYKKYKQRRNSIFATEEFSKLLIETTSDLVYVVRYKPVCHFEYISPSITPLTGYLPEDFYASPQLFDSVIHPDDLPKLKRILEANSPDILENSIQFRLAKPDKSLAYFEQKIFPIFDNNKTCTGVYAIAKRIDLSQPTFQDLYNIDRLNTISQMASSVAHEIRNPMTTVRGYLQFFSAKEDFANYKNQFELLISELDRSNLIITEYLSLNQTKLSQHKLCQLNVIIQSLYPLLKAESNNISKNIEIELGNIPEIYLNEKELRQLILNMVRNGLESMHGMNERTTVTIVTFVSDDNIILSIKDQGTGIPPDILADLGKPFLTTKEQGTGLGLLVCYQIAANHQARININTDHNGTEFIIQFPISVPIVQNT